MRARSPGSLPAPRTSPLRRLGHAVRAAVLAGALAAPLSAQTYDFESTPLNTATPLSITTGGLTATFSSPADPGAFVVTPAFLSPALPGHVLARPSSAAAPLQIAFSAPLSFIGMNFALNFGPALTLDAFLGATLVGSVSAGGVVPAGFTFPEGTISFGAATFDNVRLSAASEFAIDNVTVRQAAVVPEPSTWALTAGGLGLLGVAARRKRTV